MQSVLTRAALACAALVCAACGPPVPPAPDAQTADVQRADTATDADAAADDVNQDPDPVFTDASLAALHALSPVTLPASPADPTNAVADNPAAAQLGQRLFFDPGFSGPLLDTDNDGSAATLGMAGQTGRVACAGCHLPAGGYSDTRSFQLQISLGAGWGRRRAPSLLDVGQARLIMWDGRRDSLFSQVFGPIETVVEMNSSRLYAAEQVYLHYRADYESLFGPLPPLGDTSRFPALSASVTGCVPSTPSSPMPACDGPEHGIPGDHAEFDGMALSDQAAVTSVVVNMGKAIGAYERLLSCGPSAFDAWMHGDATAVSRAAQRGAALFVGRGDCVRCHAGPFMTDQGFHNVGLAPAMVQQNFIDANDQGAAQGIAELIASPLNSAGAFSSGTDGRVPTSVPPGLVGAFRTPGLRCVAQRPTFMHTGQLGTLTDVVAFFAAGGGFGGSFPGTNELHALGLSPLEQSDLVAFLATLNGPGPAAALRTRPAM